MSPLFEAHAANVQRLARTIYVSLQAAGGHCTRRDLSGWFADLAFRPTHGEIGDALHFLESLGKIRLEGQSFDTTITTPGA